MADEQPQGVTYLVQREFTYANLDPDHEDHAAWRDIATVTVPPRTKRRVVIRQALAEAGLKPGESTERFRALDVDSAEVIEAEPYQREPEWRI